MFPPTERMRPRANCQYKKVAYRRSETQDTLDQYLAGYRQRYPGQAKLLNELDVVYQDDLQPEATQRNVNGHAAILIGPKFFALQPFGPDALDTIVTHEIGHYVSSKIGAAIWSVVAEQAGLDVWENLPWGTTNMEEAFADTYMVVTMEPTETRHPDWQAFVKSLI